MAASSLSQTPALPPPTPKNPGTTVGNWIGGCNSLLLPESIAKNQYSWGENVVCRGGLVQTRPGFGYRCAPTVGGTRLQGAGIFSPINGVPVMLVAIDGLIYAGKYPFNSFAQLTDLQFSPSAPIINFCSVLQQVKLNPDGTLTFLPVPKPFIVIQDGITKAGTYDGTTSQHVTSGAPSYGIPIGLWMYFTNNTLWVANGPKVYVSDISNPGSFFNSTYLADLPYLSLPDNCTGLIETTDQKSLLAFTENTTTAFMAYILDRTQWGTTPGFQRVIIPDVGCVAGRSCLNQYGMTWWFSKDGWIDFNAAMYVRQTAAMTTMDDQMMRSKRILSADRSGICAGNLENYLVLSVPAGGKNNEQTWVFDQAPTGQVENIAGQAQAPAIAVGIWTGVRPVAWMRCTFGGKDTLYFVSQDYTQKDESNIHVWEAFTQDRMDNGNPITCLMETGCFLGVELQRFRYCELDIIELYGDVTLNIFAGGLRGPWLPIQTITLQAQIGSLQKSLVITKDSILQSLKPQSRIVKSQEFNPQGLPPLVETNDTAGKDKGFQILCTWQGRMAIRSIRVVMEPDPSGDKGSAPHSEAGEVNAINDQGQNVTT